MVPGFTRRHFLVGSVASLATSSLPQRHELAKLLGKFPESQAQLGDPDMIVYSQKFLTMEMPMAALTSWITPTNSFFVRNNLLMPAPIDLDKWELRVTGEVQKSLTISFRDLASLTNSKVTNTLECAGNGRAFYDPRLGGVQWRRGGAGNAVFEGPQLRTFLRKAGVKPSAHHVAFIGLDIPPAGAEPFIRSIPLEKALDENTLIATHMNGAPLTPPHGFPARALVPGWIGSASIKWLREIRVLPNEFAGMYMDPGYRVPAEQATVIQAARRNALATLPLTTLRLKSIIAQPGENSVINLADQWSVALCGAAWGGEKTISAVEVSTDGGVTWQAAMLGPDQSRYSWRLWRYDWSPKAAGEYQLLSRAIDMEGHRQPMKSPWNNGGYLWNGVDRINVQVKS